MLIVNVYVLRLATISMRSHFVRQNIDSSTGNHFLISVPFLVGFIIFGVIVAESTYFSCQFCLVSLTLPPSSYRLNTHMDRLGSFSVDSLVLDFRCSGKSFYDLI